jgi:CMP-N,N'-diacetyllegionaminic acid synthase
MTSLEYFREQCTAIVPVRDGSKGLPGKNIRSFCGRPLYQHASMQGGAFANRCIVSTDIAEILGSPVSQGFEVLTRSSELASDSASMDAVLLDICERMDLNGPILLLQATSPLRTPEDIAQACELFLTSTYKLVMSVTSADSGFLKYGFLSNGGFSPVSKPEYCFSNRQNLPRLYRPNGAIYVFDAKWFRGNGSLATNAIGAFEMPLERSIDIDTLDDFKRAESVYAMQAEGRHDTQSVDEGMS